MVKRTLITINGIDRILEEVDANTLKLTTNHQPKLKYDFDAVGLPIVELDFGDGFTLKVGDLLHEYAITEFKYDSTDLISGDMSYIIKAEKINAKEELKPAESQQADKTTT